VKETFINSDRVQLKGTTTKLSDWQHATDPTKIDGADIYSGSIPTAALADAAVTDAKIANATNFIEIVIPLVTEAQSVTSTTLTTLNGQHIWTVGSWNANRIQAIYVELEWESGGAADIDLYNATDAAKLADLKAPTAATAKTIERIDVTTAVKGLTADKVLAIQAAGDGTNPVTVYTAKLIVVITLG
jgi:hypothetical protein